MLVRDVRLGPKVQSGLFGAKYDKSGTFSDQNFKTDRNVLKYDLKNPEFVPFGANLTHFWPKSDTRGADVTWLVQAVASVEASDGAIPVAVSVTPETTIRSLLSFTYTISSTVMFFQIL